MKFKRPGKGKTRIIISDLVNTYLDKDKEFQEQKYEMLGAIWYYLYHLKNVKNTQGEVLLW